MKTYPLILIFGALCVSCKKPDETTVRTEPNFNSLRSGIYHEDEFSPWMTKAEQQVVYDRKHPGSYFACTEGRNNGGLNQYRHILKPVPSDKYSEWAIYWGLNPDEFYDIELKMLRSGFVREHLQVFTDSQGVALHQAVWLKIKPTVVTTKLPPK